MGLIFWMESDIAREKRNETLHQRDQTTTVTVSNRGPLALSLALSI